MTYFDLIIPVVIEIRFRECRFIDSVIMNEMK